MTEDCSQTCVCTESSSVSCLPKPCGSETVCGVANMTRGCYRSESISMHVLLPLSSLPRVPLGASAASRQTLYKEGPWAGTQDGPLGRGEGCRQERGCQVLPKASQNVSGKHLSEASSTTLLSSRLQTIRSPATIYLQPVEPGLFLESQKSGAGRQLQRSHLVQPPAQTMPILVL